MAASVCDVGGVSVGACWVEDSVAWEASLTGKSLWHNHDTNSAPSNQVSSKKLYKQSVNHRALHGAKHKCNHPQTLLL